MYAILSPGGDALPIALAHSLAGAYCGYKRYFVKYIEFC
jgi:hypothetical protein